MKADARSSHRLKLLAALGGIALGLLAAEVALRITTEPATEFDVLTDLAAEFEPPPVAIDCANATEQARLREIVAPGRHPDLIYELRADVTTCFEGTRVETNSQGIRRTAALEIPKPAGTHRLLVLGDSHAFGWAIPERDTIAAQLEARLAAVHDGPVEVLNAGVPGYSAYQEAAWLEAYGAGLEPDCVVVLFVANDLGLPHFLLRPPEPSASRLWDRIRAATSSKRWFSFAPNELATFVSELDMDRVPARYHHMVGEPGYRRALAKLAAWGRAHDAEIVNLFDYSTLALDPAALLRHQSDLGITALEMPWPNGSTYRVSASDPHLNRTGNAIVTDFLISELERRFVCLPVSRESVP